MKLLATEDARARMLAEAVKLPAESVSLAVAQGRTLAEDVVAMRDQPPFDASAMDGWAVRAADTPGRLKIAGESAAGHGYAAELRAGEAVRIFTGAAVPDGADTVIIQENAAPEGGAVTVSAATQPRNIRRRGHDFKAGQVLLKAGVRLDPWRLSLAASSGRAELPVSARPKVTILSTGEEIVPPGANPGPFQIYNSGVTSLSALCATWGVELVPVDNVGDNEDAIAAAAASVRGDVLVTLGGASVGDHDLVKPALARLGLTMIVESVAIRPGKPTWFARLADGRRVVGLPGNPASAMACAELFLKPFLMAMQGADPSVRLLTAQAAEPLAANGAREHWMRAKLAWSSAGVLMATPLRDQDSSLVTVFEAADALLRRPVNAPAAAVGDPLDVLPLARL